MDWQPASSIFSSLSVTSKILRTMKVHLKHSILNQVKVKALRSATIPGLVCSHSNHQLARKVLNEAAPADEAIVNKIETTRDNMLSMIDCFLTNFARKILLVSIFY